MEPGEEDDDVPELLKNDDPPPLRLELLLLHPGGSAPFTEGWQLRRSVKARTSRINVRTSVPASRASWSIG